MSINNYEVGSAVGDSYEDNNVSAEQGSDEPRRLTDTSLEVIKTYHERGGIIDIHHRKNITTEQLAILATTAYLATANEQNPELAAAYSHWLHSDGDHAAAVAGLDVTRRQLNGLIKRMPKVLAEVYPVIRPRGDPTEAMLAAEQPEDERTPIQHEAPMRLTRKPERVAISLTILANPSDGQMCDNWMERALCKQADPDLFFPERGESTQEAKAVCNSCEVKDECLKFALDNNEKFGIWGGLSVRERNRLKR